MPTENDRIITFEYAKNNWNSYKKKEIPNTKTCMTKQDIYEYLSCDMNVLSGYTNNRLVPRVKFVPITLNGFNDKANKIAVHSDGKYVVVGKFTTYGGETFNRIIRFNPDHTVDRTFNMGLGFNDSDVSTEVLDVKIDSQGRIYCCGKFNIYNNDQSSTTGKNVIRLNYDGTRDTTFNVQDIGYYGSTANCIKLVGDKILIGGLNFTQQTARVATYVKIVRRLNQNGSIDTSFVHPDIFPSQYNNKAKEGTFSIEVRPNGNIICIGGVFKGRDISTLCTVVEFNSTGTEVRTSRNATNFYNYYGYTSYLNSDGTLLVGGYDISYDRVNDSSLNFVKLDVNLTNATNSSYLNTSGYGEVRCIKPVNDGFIIGGIFDAFNTSNKGYTNGAYLNSNLQSSANNIQNNSLNYNNAVLDAAVVNNNSLVTVGRFTDNNGAPANYIQRFGISV